MIEQHWHTTHFLTVFELTDADLYVQLEDKEELENKVCRSSSNYQSCALNIIHRVIMRIFYDFHSRMADTANKVQLGSEDVTLKKNQKS